MNLEDKVLLVGADTGENINFELSMEELGKLAEACNMQVVGSVVQKVWDINKAYYIGTGKVAEVKELAASLKADMVIFDNALSPSQLANLQDAMDIAVMDRTTLILEIFSSRAKSREAKLQVEVARLQYLLPRLTGLGKALSRQGGASGSKSSKGAGEKKLELDRRYLERRLNEMRRELKEVVNQRQTQRKLRDKSGIARVALVGYTNAGKSTLMNSMLKKYEKEEEKQVFAKDMLFATLDTTVRKIQAPDRMPVLLSDTVGFIHELPHNLVEAFKSTLEEAVQADLLLQVVDVSDINHKEQIEVTNHTLAELGAGHIPLIYVYNKADCVVPTENLPKVQEDKIYISAKEGVGLDELMELIENKLSGGYCDCTMLVPYSRGDVVGDLETKGAIRKREYLEEGTKITVHCTKKDAGKYKEFLI